MAATGWCTSHCIGLWSTQSHTKNHTLRSSSDFHSGKSICLNVRRGNSHAQESSELDLYCLVLRSNDLPFATASHNLGSKRWIPGTTSWRCQAAEEGANGSASQNGVLTNPAHNDALSEQDRQFVCELRRVMDSKGLPKLKVPTRPQLSDRPDLARGLRTRGKIRVARLLGQFAAAEKFAPKPFPPPGFPSPPPVPVPKDAASSPPQSAPRITPPDASRTVSKVHPAPEPSSQTSESSPSSGSSQDVSSAAPPTNSPPKIPPSIFEQLGSDAHTTAPKTARGGRSGGRGFPPPFRNPQATIDAVERRRQQGSMAGGASPVAQPPVPPSPALPLTKPVTSASPPATSTPPSVTSTPPPAMSTSSSVTSSSSPETPSKRPVASPSPPEASPPPSVTSPSPTPTLSPQTVKSAAPPVSSAPPPVTSPSHPVASPSPALTPPSPVVTSSSPPTASRSPPVTSNPPPVTPPFHHVRSATPPTTSAPPPATPPLSPVTSSSPPMASPLPPVTSSSPPVVPSSQHVTSTSSRATPISPPLTSSSPPASSSSPPVTSSSQPVTSPETPVTAPSQPVASSATPVTSASPSLAERAARFLQTGKLDEVFKESSSASGETSHPTPSPLTGADAGAVSSLPPVDAPSTDSIAAQKAALLRAKLRQRNASGPIAPPPVAAAAPRPVAPTPRPPPAIASSPRPPVAPSARPPLAAAVLSPVGPVLDSLQFHNEKLYRDILSEKQQLEQLSLSERQEEDEFKAQTFQELGKIKEVLESRETDVASMGEALKEARAQLNLLRAKSAAELAQARQEVLELRTRLRSAEKALEGLKQVRVEYWIQGESVQLAGSFNGWGPSITLDPDPSTEIPLPSGGRGPMVFACDMRLYPGDYEIKFIVDGNWQVDSRRQIVYRGMNQNNLLRVE